MKTGTVRAVCLSERKGTPKQEAPSAVLTEDWGIQGDAHAGKWHRQVSLLGLEQIEAFRSRGAFVPFGAFGENLVIEGIRTKDLPLGTVLQIGSALLEITQIGKECHGHCAIYRETGDCIMPREGVFAKVLRGGVIRPGDPVSVADDSEI